MPHGKCSRLRSWYKLLQISMHHRSQKHFVLSKVSHTLRPQGLAWCFARIWIEILQRGRCSWHVWQIEWEQASLIQRCTVIQLDSPGFELGLLRNTTGMRDACWENSRCLHWIIDFGRFNLLFPWSLPLFQEDMEVLLNQLADYIDLTFVKDGYGDGRYEKICERFIQQLT